MISDYCLNNMKIFKIYSCVSPSLPKLEFNKVTFFIDYAITVAPVFPHSPFHPAPPTPSGSPHTTVHVHGSCV